MSQLRIRKVAVLGAGVMGAQIAAHLVNADVDTLLFDLPAQEGDKNGIVQKAIANLGKLSPAPLASKAKAAAIIPANYEQHLPQLADCDLIIEAIAEKMEWKKALYEKIAPHVAPHAIVASNTSGLSINALAEAMPAAVRPRFCGVHFFNPPRYMHLAELIPCAGTEPAVLQGLETFLTTTLGKGVVYAKDTPNFIGNRIGVFSILAGMHHTERLGLGFDEVDAITGPLIGRPKSATYRTSDVVGLDTMAHVIKTMADTLPDDPWHAYFKAPDWLQALIARGALGQKAGAGIYRKQGKDILVLDLAKQDYRPSGAEANAEVVEILKIKNPAEKFAKLRAHSHPQAQFLWAIFRDLFHYAAFHLHSIADTARDVDFAMRWGYGWSLGPFETWQAAGWQQVAAWIAEDIAAGRAMASAPLPAWVSDGRAGVHSAEGSFSPARNAALPRSTLPVYARQRFPETVIGEAPANPGATVFETDAVRLWTDGDGIAVLGFKTKMHTVSDGVLAGIQQAIDIAEKDFRGLVIWQPKAPFSAGADLAGALAALQAGRLDDFTAMVATFQATSQRIKYALVPVVAAVRGLALGGGCEFQMHAARTVAHLESYIGLVEAGVGLLPAGGGLKEIAARASARAKNGDVFAELRPMFETVAMGKVSSSALEAKELGLLRESDIVVFHEHELLHVARQTALAMAEAGYRPPLPNRQITAAGDVGIATFKMMLVNMLEGRMISPHDMEIATRIATVLSGGEIDRGATVDEDWLIRLEREHFVALAQMPKTQERIAHMLKTGKPLRN
ncbi:3-hydroxyacyl-CoA dehydrogenase/enoyl-CoA hydratase family protein [Silanimonas lenta]|uniref:3-hydroxyacyl-CoA dehydrogenase/enoyl-CoA hydratase family protein n=1 Tax=Silanimonas lenta TaxID=265429 RepID=UPI00040EFE6D|nr:3-hydroxyacyl-CoA dehydrogenase/enoyl-CoA hydratase family protein [Silanimonas lenta]